MPRLLITGANGFLGSRAAAYFAALGWQVTACTRAEADLTDADATARFFSARRPEYVLHCAAISDTGACERDPALSLAVNLHGTEHVAAACAGCGAKLVYMSSDQVYAGCPAPGPFAEGAARCPDNVYGRHKLAAETAVQALLPAAVGLRLSWLYELPAPGVPGHGWPAGLLAAAQNGGTVRAAAHDRRGITPAALVLEKLSACFLLPGGVYNFGCGCSGSTLETYRAAAALLGLPAALIVPDTERWAQHPRSLAMELGALRARGLDFPDTLPALAQALAHTAR